MAWKQFVARLAFAVSFSFVVLAAKSQDKKTTADETAQQIAKRCNPVFVKRPKLKTRAIHVREGEKPTGHTPIMVFQITSDGEVRNARVKRSSGIRDMDDSALSWLRSSSYTSRPGCPVIDNETDVLIDFS